MTSKTYDFLDEGELAQMYPEVGGPVCPDCGDGLLKGPQGGACTNIKCKGCSAEFNVMPGTGVQRITDKQKTD